MFYENVTNRILSDFVAGAAPRWLRLEAEFAARGGITTTVTVTHDSSEID
ncbi:MAG: hypothetical protein ACKOUR_03880 [Planctomycetota bacterium]